MIHEMELNNFRAFKSEKFNFSKLNIFVGPNNSGKSSALSAINLIAQSVVDGSFGSGPVTLNGQFDKLGTFKDMVHGGRANTPVRISISIQEFIYEFELKYRSQRREVELSRFKISEEKKVLYEYISSKDKYDIFIGGKNIDNVGRGLRKTRPIFNGIIPFLSHSFRYYESVKDSSSSDISEEVYAFLRNHERKLSRFQRLMIDTFRSYDTLGAFREMPQRTYLFSGETASKIGRMGQNTVTILASDVSKRGSEQVGFVDQISQWLKRTGIATGVKVKYLTDRHFELVIVGKDGTDHNICDVGFGCSQVLPVLVSGLGINSNSRGRGIPSRHPILVIQEPEIHLHPNAQAELGSFFANLIDGRGQIFLETHSDNLVLRVARHVASGEIDRNDVRIFYVNDEDGLKRVTPISIAEDGSFSPPWPGGFFPQRQSESFELARASMKRNKLANQQEQLNFDEDGKRK